MTINTFQADFVERQPKNPVKTFTHTLVKENIQCFMVSNKRSIIIMTHHKILIFITFSSNKGSGKIALIHRLDRAFASLLAHTKYGWGVVAVDSDQNLYI